NPSRTCRKDAEDTSAVQARIPFSPDNPAAEENRCTPFPDTRGTAFEKRTTRPPTRPPTTAESAGPCQHDKPALRLRRAHHSFAHHAATHHARAAHEWHHFHHVVHGHAGHHSLMKLGGLHSRQLASLRLGQLNFHLERRVVSGILLLTAQAPDLLV